MKILIVDDSSFSQKINANMLKNFLGDVELYFANDGKEGFELYKEVKPDYVFADLLMPNISGNDMIKSIKEYDDCAKIVVISADVQKGVKDEIEAYNIVSFINKPFNDEKAKLICDKIKGDLYE